jgi:hypothetical protein
MMCDSQLEWRWLTRWVPLHESMLAGRCMRVTVAMMLFFDVDVFTNNEYTTFERLVQQRVVSSQSQLKFALGADAFSEDEFFASGASQYAQRTSRGWPGGSQPSQVKP